MVSGIDSLAQEADGDTGTIRNLLRRPSKRRRRAVAFFGGQHQYEKVGREWSLVFTCAGTGYRSPPPPDDGSVCFALL